MGPLPNFVPYKMLIRRCMATYYVRKTLYTEYCMGVFGFIICNVLILNN